MIARTKADYHKRHARRTDRGIHPGKLPNHSLGGSAMTVAPNVQLAEAELADLRKRQAENARPEPMKPPRIVVRGHTFGLLLSAIALGFRRSKR